jgi:hypothetical protein
MVVPKLDAGCCSAVVLLSIILGSVLGTRDNTSPQTNNSITTDGDSCDNAFAPITRADVIRGSTSDGATVDIEAPSCGSASVPTAPGLWYIITGDGGNITLSTCSSTKTDFDSQISVFNGSCDQLTCIEGNDNAASGFCGGRSLVVFESIRNKAYHVLVHGFGNSTGSFDLKIVFERFVALSAFFEDGNVSSQALQDTSSPQYQALEWMAETDSTDLSDDKLVERFALVLIYFATGGPSWLDQAGFLNPFLDTCSWNSIDEGAYVLGVGCNDEGSVTTLDLCKFPKISTS